MKNLRGKKVLITGAASGIGRETALAFSAEGSLPLLADIDLNGLVDLAGVLGHSNVEYRTYHVDVSKKDQVEHMADLVLEEFGGLDILVNNAGVFVWGDFKDTPHEDWDWIMGVNLWGPIHTIKAFLPEMMRSGTGHIVNVASGGGLVTLPAISAYCATKFALVGLGESLAREVEKHGVKVTTICPGSTKTQIINNIRVRGLDRRKLEERLYPLTNRFPAEKTGRAVLEAVKRERSMVVTTAPMKLMYLVHRFSPRLYLALMSPAKRLFYSTMR